jgi:hypothetical protein
VLQQLKPRKKANHTARPDEKAQPKVERNASRAAVEREAARAATRTKASKPVVQAQAADPIAQKSSVSQNATEAAPAVVPPPSADQAFKEESRNEGLVAAAGTVWPALPNTDSASTVRGAAADAVQAVPANTIKVIVTNEVPTRSYGHFH